MAAALHITPFLIINIGSEMLFVIAQRLEAQRVQQDKAVIVMDEISSALFAEEITSALFEPRTPFTHEAVRVFFESVAHSSFMQLDKYSMGRLWDLITMIYKWQTTMSPDIITVTRNHLTELLQLVDQPKAQLLIEKTRLMFEDFIKQFTQHDFFKIRNILLTWLNVFKVKVSILMKLGLQNPDGSFVGSHFDDRSAALLRNLGHNIYAMQKTTDDNFSKEQYEINTFVDEILGETKTTQTFININIGSGQEHTDEENNDDSKQSNQVYSNIDCSNTNRQFENIFEDVSKNDNNVAVGTSSFTDELLDMIDSNVEQK